MNRFCRINFTISIPIWWLLTQWISSHTWYDFCFPILSEPSKSLFVWDEEVFTGVGYWICSWCIMRNRPVDTSYCISSKFKFIIFVQVRLLKEGWVSWEYLMRFFSISLTLSYLCHTYLIWIEIISKSSIMCRPHTSKINRCIALSKCGPMAHRCDTTSVLTHSPRYLIPWKIPQRKIKMSLMIFLYMGGGIFSHLHTLMVEEGEG